MKKFMLLIMALMIAGLALAQTDITIGTGTSTGRYPFNDYFVYSRSQCIYLESEIGAPGTIHKLRWYRSDAGADPNAIGTTQIWLKTVSNTVMTDVNWEDPGTMVAEISNIDLGAGNAWYEIDITDFVYNGGNLLVSVYTQNAPYTSPHSYWRYTATTGYLCRLGNSDSSNPPTLSLSTARPNIQINMTTGAPSVAPNPAILSAPANGGYALIGDLLRWNSGGGFPATYDVYLDTVDGSTLVSDNQTGLTYTPTLAPGTTYYWKVVASNAFGDAAPSPTWSFMTPAADQLVESFENTSFPPAGWANPGSWLRGTTYYKHGTAGAYKAGSTTATYVLSTPKVTITPTSTLNFWAAGSSTTTSILQVVYSADRITWTQIGANITPTATYTMVNYSIDLSSLAGNNYYLGFQNGAGAGTNYIDFVVGPAITPEAPGVATLSTPADLATNVNEFTSFTWTAPTTGGVPTGYKLYVDTVNPPVAQVADLNALTYTLTTPLAYNTTYYWTVEAYNGAGTGPQATVRSFTTRANPTITAFPWVETFGTTGAAFPPLNWSNMTGLIGQPLTTGGVWYQDDFGNVVTTPPNYSGRLNIWSTTTRSWLITPPVAIPANHELKFDLAYTTYSGTATPTPGAQPDDRFVVLISDNPQMTGATILREWNNTGSPYVYDTISNVGENHIISLGAYTGTKYIAFYGESTVSGGDNNVYVDNVTVRETPVSAIFNLTPDVTDWNFGMAAVNYAKTKVFTISNTGGAPLTLTNVSTTGSYYSISAAPGLMTIPAGSSTTFTVQFLPTVVGGPFTGTLDIVFNRETRTINLSGSSYEPATLPISEGFETGFGTWIVENGTQVNQWTVGTATFNTGAQSAYISNDNGVSNAYDIAAASTVHLYQDIAFPTGTERYNLSFNWKGYGESASYDYLQVFLVDTTVDPVAGTRLSAGQIGVNYNMQNTWQNTLIQIPNTVDGQVKRLVFSWWNDTSVGTQPPIAVDDISLVAVYPSAPDPVTVTYPANEATGLPMGGFDITWTPAVTGGIPTYYAVYMSTDESTIYDDLYWETTDTSFNPVTDGGVTFDYLDRWYFTVQAFNDEGDALVDPPYWFEIEDAPQIITTFPWVENFDAAAALPTDWTLVDVDAGGTTWVSSTTYAHSAPNAFKHAYSTAVPDPGQNGWLITPAIQVPAGNYYLSWWNYNVYPTWMVYNGVKVNTTNDPNALGWTEIWSQGTAASAWSQAVVNISAYAGQTVYFAFNYQGYDGDDWYIDDVSVYELSVDTFGPVITHLPLINTPREDLGNYVVADIADDATWNNPIGGANMYYSIDGGTTWSTPVAMTLDVAPTYYAFIPPQALGTTVTYKIEAWDSLNNMTTTNNYAYTVADPTWIWYDQGGTTYLGYTTTDFGPTVLFENPFYGTGNAMQLLAVDGSSYYGNAANLQIYTYDGTTMTPFFTTPIPVTFGAQTYETFDLSTYNVQITTPYFMVSYLDVPMGNYILFDSTYDYGTTYVFQGTTLYTMSNSGSWAIGANVTTGMNLALDTPVVAVALGLTGVDLSWDAVAGAAGYKVLAASDPYAADPWTELAYITGTTYTYTGVDGYKFFKVVATSEAPIVRGATTSLPTRSFGNAVKAPKVIINNIRN